MPNAIQIMSQATYDAGLTTENTVAAMLKLQQTGGVISSEVLPHFAARMKEAAQANGGLEKAMDSNRVAMNRMITGMQVGADQFFKAGFADGLTDVFNSIGELFKDNEVLWESLGKIIGGILKGVAFIVREVINPVLSAFGSILNLITGLFGDFSAAFLAPFLKGSPIISAVVEKLGGMAGIFKKLIGFAKNLLMPFIGILGILEEIAEFFKPTGKRTLIGANINDIIPDISKVHETMKKSQALTSEDEPTRTKALQAQFSKSASSDQGMWQNFKPQVQLNATVNLDGEAVGEIVLESEAAGESMNRVMSARMASNFN